MGRFRSGIGRLVAGTGIAVVPCHLTGGLEAWPKGSVFARPGKLHLRIDVARHYAHLDKTADSVREICHDLEERVAALGRRGA